MTAQLSIIRKKLAPIAFRTCLCFLIVLLILSFAQALYAAGMKNLAALSLYPLWQQRLTQIFDPPCYTDGRFPEIERQLQPAVILGDARALTHLGRMQWLEGHCAEATHTWGQAWTIARDPAAAFELARVGEYAMLPSNVRRAIADGFYQHGITVAKSQGDETSFVWLRRSFDLMPDHRGAGALVAYYRKTENTAAISQLWHEMADALPVTEAEHWWAVAELYALNNQRESAAQAYTRGAELANEPYDFWMRAGSAWMQARQWDAAIAAYQRAYQENSAAWTCISLGRVYQARGDHTNALRWYEEAKAKSPQDPEAYYRMGETYYSTKDYAQARQYFNKALQMDPEHFLSMYYVAKINYDQGNRDQAEKWMLDALARIPWRDTKAAWWIELGDWRLGWRDCAGARMAYASAQEIGAEKKLVEQKIEILSKKCVP